MFNVVENLSVKLLTGTNIMDKFVTSIYPAKRRLKPLRSKMMAILSIEASAKLAAATAPEQ